MHHLQELNRKRPLYLNLLTPEDVAPPIQKTFIIKTQTFGTDAEAGHSVPLLPLKSRSNHHIVQESEKTFEDVLMERKR